MHQPLVMQDGNIYSVTRELTQIECFRCGECCVRFWQMLFEMDITSMARELLISRDYFFSKYVQVIPDRGTFILDNGEKQCPFYLGAENPVKPLVWYIILDRKLVEILWPAYHGMNVRTVLRNWEAIAAFFF